MYSGKNSVYIIFRGDNRDSGGHGFTVSESRVLRWWLPSLRPAQSMHDQRQTKRKRQNGNRRITNRKRRKQKRIRVIWFILWRWISECKKRQRSHKRIGRPWRRNSRLRITWTRFTTHIRPIAKTNSWSIPFNNEWTNGSIHLIKTETNRNGIRILTSHQLFHLQIPSAFLLQLWQRSISSHRFWTHCHLGCTSHRWICSTKECH